MSSTCGGLSTLTRFLARDLRLRGAIVISVDEPDAIAQANAANRFGADLYVGFEARADGASRICYYSVPTFESVGGRSLAERLVTAFAGISSVDPCLAGMRLQVLRETKMPAVLASFGSVRQTVDHAHDFAHFTRVAIEQWAACPLETGSHPG